MAQKYINKSPSSLGNPGEESIVTEHASSVSEGQDLFVEGSFDIGDTTAACESSFRKKMKSLPKSSCINQPTCRGVWHTSPCVVCDGRSHTIF